MIAGGTGGANTQTGKIFEIKTDLLTALTKANYNVKNFIFIQQRKFPKYLKDNFNFDMREEFGKEFWPDEAVIYNNQLFIIEKKQQTSNGTVDEKIQTGPYKLFIYKKCAEIMNLQDAKYIYLLSKDFNTNKYTKHQIPYLNSHNIPVYFEELPLEKIFN